MQILCYFLRKLIFCVFWLFSKEWNFFPPLRAEGAFRSVPNHKVAPRKTGCTGCIYPNITLARLFEGLDEVWNNNVRPLKKILGKWPCFEEPRFHFLWVSQHGKWSSHQRFRCEDAKKSENRDSENDRLVRSGLLRLFLGEYWVVLGRFRCFPVKLGPFFEIRIFELNKKFSRVG